MTHPIVLFDGECNLCNASVQWIIAHDREKKFRFAARESNVGAGLLTQFGIARLDSVAVIAAGRVYSRSSAAIFIAQELDAPWAWLAIFKIVPGFLRDPAYDFIASHRYRWFGKTQACWLPAPELQERFLK